MEETYTCNVCGPVGEICKKLDHTSYIDNNQCIRKRKSPAIFDNSPNSFRKQKKSIPKQKKSRSTSPEDPSLTELSHHNGMCYIPRENGEEPFFMFSKKGYENIRNFRLQESAAARVKFISCLSGSEYVYVPSSLDPMVDFVNNNEELARLLLSVSSQKI